MRVFFECQYCGNKWDKDFWVSTAKESVAHEVCGTCGDKPWKISDKAPEKIDYYEGCPAFIEDLKLYGR